MAYQASAQDLPDGADDENAAYHTESLQSDTVSPSEEFATQDNAGNKLYYSEAIDY